MAEATAPVYGSQEYFDELANVYRRTTAPDVERSTAQLKNLLGGQGALQGTPILGKYIENIEKPYQTGLQNMLSGQMTGLSQFKAQQPYTEAGITGYYGGSPTLGRESYEKAAEIAQNQQDLESLQNIIGYFGGVQGLMNLLGRLAGQDPTTWGG